MDSSYYKVTQYNDTSTLWIANVTWENSKWFVEDDNLEFGKIDLDINVRPKIETKSTSTEHIVMAKCSHPRTTIRCYYGQERLSFTHESVSKCPDGRTFSTIGILRYPRLCGDLTCWFTIGKIFMEDRLLKFGMKPKIEITKSSCEYKITARDSSPLTSIECFAGNKLLEFTNVRKSNSSDERTFRNIMTLLLSNYSGNVTCNVITIMENQCKNPTPRSNTVIIVFVVLFSLLLILVCFLFWYIMKTCKRRRETGETPKLSIYNMMQNKETGETPKLSIYNMMQNKENGQVLKHGYVPVNYEGPSIILDEEADSRPVSNEGRERESQPNENIPASIEGRERESQPNENIPASIEGPFHGTCSMIIAIH
ncbi:uncharacterized protein LOC115232395 isoform X2 [Octopus sinensis]|uniref:Uncharacterized protein LOC115232395 isoform X2 n=1 Tax=Octopus sinensis TaxID=2607531 RepID=A0A7E6FI99_9MOLL|nr:uncharacterized protein LOC115232395 isoform X2 [Octopus sinensis]